MVNTITRFGCAADGREAIRCIRCSSRREEALIKFGIRNWEFGIGQSFLTSPELPGGCSAGVLACECTGRPARCSCWRRDTAATRSREGCATRLMGGRRFPSKEGFGVGRFVQSPLFLSDLLADHEPILTPSHEESLHSEALGSPPGREVVAGSPPGRAVAVGSPPGRGQRVGWYVLPASRLPSERLPASEKANPASASPTVAGETPALHWRRDAAATRSRDGCATTFVEVPSFFRMHWNHETLAVPRRTESADKSDALQTLRAGQGSGRRVSVWSACVFRALSQGSDSMPGLGSWKVAIGKSQIANRKS